MQAFILAAGYGTRLKPLTDSRPKALVEVKGTPLIKITIDSLTRLGINRIVVNVHHFSNMLIQYLHTHHWNTEIIISDESDMLLDTGAGLKKAEPLFAPDEPILIHNVDILTRFDLTDLVRQHIDSMNYATLAVSQRDTSRLLIFDMQDQLAGWKNSSTGEIRWTDEPISSFKQLAFSGIAMIQPQLVTMLPPATHPYPIIPAYLELAKNHRISYYKHKKDDWIDVGKPRALTLAQNW